MKKHQKPSGRETAYQSSLKADGKPKSSQPRDDKSRGKHKPAHAAQPERNRDDKGMVHHA